ncbi:hypothetical protein Syn8016DRAFT_1649 [Synechococcus sp. WH 8016]|nr:hypothetical protein Syn8016DRAFT_1649 [Synechococcus sp. WH 8016]
MKRLGRPWSSTLPICSTVDALSGCYPGDAVVALRHLKVSPLIFRDQSIAADADLLPMLDSAVNAITLHADRGGKTSPH